MGIFDDAIREHLELKRNAGAEEDELKELEDEAFGLPTRPGEPDFPGSQGEAAADAGEQPEGGPFDAAADDAASGAEASDAPSEAVIAPRNEAVGALQEAPEVQPEAEADPEAEVVAPDASVEEPEEAAETFAKPFDALAEDGEPEPEPEAPDTSTSFTTQEREAIADQPTVFFEQQEPAELELGDLDLDLDEELEEVGDMINEPLTDEEPLVPEAATPAEPVGEVAPVEPLEETEPEFEPEPLTPTEPEAALEVEEVEAEALEAEPEDSALPAMDEGELTSEDDVLEETPEFLRENPDDDDLWFEQGAPKDFDF